MDLPHALKACDDIQIPERLQEAVRDAQPAGGLAQLEEQIAQMPTLAPPLFGVAQAIEALLEVERRAEWWCCRGGAAACYPGGLGCKGLGLGRSTPP